MTREYPIPNGRLAEGNKAFAQAEELAFWEVSLVKFATGKDSELALRDQPGERVFDLEERTARFGEQVIRFCKTIPHSPTNNPLISQLVRAGTSVGANYCEADDAVSKREFKHKIGTCRKEAKETKYWLRMAATAEELLKTRAREVWKEARELHLIFCAIYNRS
jgi:four helix bundle protein